MRRLVMGGLRNIHYPFVIRVHPLYTTEDIYFFRPNKAVLAKATNKGG